MNQPRVIDLSTLFGSLLELGSGQYSIRQVCQTKSNHLSDQSIVRKNLEFEEEGKNKNKMNISYKRLE